MAGGCALTDSSRAPRDSMRAAHDGRRSLVRAAVKKVREHLDDSVGRMRPAIRRPGAVLAQTAQVRPASAGRQAHGMGVPRTLCQVV